MRWDDTPVHLLPFDSNHGLLCGAPPPLWPVAEAPPHVNAVGTAYYRDVTCTDCLERLATALGREIHADALG